MKKCILIVGTRRKCYESAIELGHEVVLWNDGELNSTRKKKLQGWIEEPYSESAESLSLKVIEELKKYQIERVIATTEKSVVLSALVREYLNLDRMAVDITQRFHNKLVMKDFAIECEIPITKYKSIDKNTTTDSLIEYLGLPVVIKPVDKSGASDIKVAHNSKDLSLFMEPGLLAEAFVKGSEVSVETFIQDGKPVFHNITEYLHQWRKSVVPAELEKNLRSKILKINDKVIKDFGVDRGMTHAEFYLTEAGPVFGEIAVRPPGGYYMELIEKVYGFNSWQLYVNLCCKGHLADFKPSQDGCAAVYMIHPGPGKVKSISGLDEINDKVKGIFNISIRSKPGDMILPHQNTSNEVGHILFWAPSREQLNLDIEFIESTLKFEFV